MNSIPEIGQTVLNFIGGKWQPSESDEWSDRYDPADRSVLVARAPDSSADDARQAIEAAAEAAENWNAPTRQNAAGYFSSGSTGWTHTGINWLTC
jgi:acyl-CoA reductase-like NAD-dependent aldehyde dehydrogenase